MEKFLNWVRGSSWRASFLCSICASILVRIIGRLAGVDPDSDLIYPVTLVAVIFTACGLAWTFRKWLYK